MSSFSSPERARKADSRSHQSACFVQGMMSGRRAWMSCGGANLSAINAPSTTHHDSAGSDSILVMLSNIVGENFSVGIGLRPMLNQ